MAKGATVLPPSPKSKSKANASGKFYIESRPVLGTTYFPKAGKGVNVAALVCLYNEDVVELKRTLDSLIVGPPIDVVVIADGLEKLSASIRQYFLDVFCLSPDALNDDTYDIGDANFQIFISRPVAFGDSGTRGCVLLKRFNHKKINSHEWFFKAHTMNTGCKYGLTSDCGALFRPGTVMKLIAHLDTYSKCVGVTGHQQVMSEYNHRVLGRTLPELDTWLDWALRSWQDFDLKLDSFSNKAADCAGRFLLCLHGPCSMFRLSDINGECLETYFEEWGYAPLPSLSLLCSNLQLGEDRILSLLVAISSCKHVACCFDAAFELDPELSLYRLIAQRRRWANVILSGACFAVTQLPFILRSDYSICFKVGNLLLLGARLLQHCLQLFVPAFFGVAFVSTAGFGGGVLFGTTWRSTLQVVEGTLYAMLYIMFVYVHLKRSENDQTLNHTLVKAVLMHNTTMMLFVIIAMLHHGCMNLDTMAMGLLLFSVPFVGGVVSGSLGGLITMYRSCLVYVLMAPTAFAFCGAYNFARFPDLSWGNRPAASKATEEKKRKSISLTGDRAVILRQWVEQQQWLEQQMSLCALGNMVLVIANIALMFYIRTMMGSLAKSWSLTSSKEYAYYDVLPCALYIFGFGIILQLFVGIGYHVGRRLSIEMI